MDNKERKIIKPVYFRQELPKPAFIQKPILDDKGKDTGYMITEYSELYNAKGENRTNYTTKDHRPFGYVSMNGGYINCSLTRLARRAFDEETYPLDHYKELVVDHINPEVPLNNRVTNLEWVSVGENRKRAEQNNLVEYRKDKNDIEKICEMLCKNISRQEIMKTVGVNGQLIDDIRAGRSHKDISSKYIPYGFEYKIFDRENRDAKVRQICEMLDEGHSASYISKALNIKGKSYVNDIKMGRSHLNISKNYKFMQDKLNGK